MVNMDLLFNYGGEWTREPTVKYTKKLRHSWTSYDSDHLSFIDIVDEYCKNLLFDGVQQLIVETSSGNYYELVGDEGIRKLLTLVCVEYVVINLYAVEDCEMPVYVPNILEHGKVAAVSEHGVEAAHSEHDQVPHSEHDQVPLPEHDQVPLPEHDEVHISDHDQDDGLDDEEDDPMFDHVNEVGTDCSSTDGEGDSDYETESSYYDSEELESIVSQRKISITPNLMDFMELDKHMTWKDIAEARKHMNLYALSNKKGLVLLKSDRTRLRYRCVDGCQFVCLISKDGDCPGVRFKTLQSEHNCSIAYDNKRVDYFTITYYFKNKLQNEPKYSVKEMRADLKAAFELNASHGKCKRAKQLILEKLQGSFKDEYNKLDAYANELIRSNPGSDIVINLSKDALAEGRRRFLRMYICFDALKKGFKAGMRPFIRLDGTFLRGKAKGQILVAIGQDSMNHFYPIAWAVVNKETKTTWTWFLKWLQKSLGLNTGEGYTFMSDMQKGLDLAMKDVLPDARHRFCVRHIEANWCKRWRSKEMKKLMWWCAWCTYEEDFHEQLSSIGEMSEQAARDLVHYPVANWCRAYFDTVCKNMGVDNNFTESFNSWILDARYKPIIKMLEDIRIKVMTMVRGHEKEVNMWKDPFSPESMALYADYLAIAHKCVANFNGDAGFEITEEETTHTVKLDEKSCTCRTWNLCGIPCAHAIKTMLHLRINPLSEMHWWYGKEAFMKTYSHKLQPVRGPKFWKVQPSQAMEPPQLVKQAGRPKTRRSREKNEASKRQGAWSAKRHGRVMFCKNCGEPNHNARGCHKASKGKQIMKKKRSANDVVPPRSKRVIHDERSIQLSAPQLSQSSQGSTFAYMPPPGFHNGQSSSSTYMPPPGFHNGQSSSSTPYSQSSSSNSFSDFGFPYFATEEEDLSLRPKVVSEGTRLEARKLPPRSKGTRVIDFKGDPLTGVCEPSNLPYQPRGLTWNGADALTTNQLLMQARSRVQKSQPRRGV